MPAPTALPTDPMRVLPAPVLDVVFVLTTAGRAVPLVLLGAALSFAARLGRWTPAKRDAGRGATVSTGRMMCAPAELTLDEELELDGPWGGRPMIMPPAAMSAGERCTPRIPGRVG